MGASNIESDGPATEGKSESEREAVSKIEESAKTDLVILPQLEPRKVFSELTEDPKWRAAFRKETDVSTEKLWAVAKDFCNLEWFSLVTSCVVLLGAEGPENTVGTLRRCKNEKAPLLWFSDERLVAIDHEKLTLTYEMVNSSLGWLNYRATLSIGRDEDENHFVNLQGEQSPRDGTTEEENVEFMKTAYDLFVTELVSKARTLQFTSPS